MKKIKMGRKVRLEDFKGKVVLMNFIYTSCPNKGCDLMSLHFLRLQLLLKDRIGKDLIFLSISIDRKGEKVAVYDSATTAVEYETEKMEADIRKLLDSNGSGYFNHPAVTSAFDLMF